MGISALEDQQLAGVIMWVPLSAIFLAAGLTVMAQLLKGASAPLGIASSGHRMLKGLALQRATMASSQTTPKVTKNCT
jgi:hypothetical protein